MATSSIYTVSGQTYIDVDGVTYAIYATSADQKSILKFSLKTNLVKSVISEISSNISRYYYVFGRSHPWGDETNPESPSDSYEYENEVRNHMLLYKQIDSNDIAAVIPRISWVAGYTFDMYAEYSSDNPSFTGATSLETAQFYCITEEYNVYKCLDNNNNSPSFNRPTGTSTDVIKFQGVGQDGYVWKYMYTIPVTLRNKFLSLSTMPVVTALTNQFYSKGAITSYSIENKGYLYPRTSYEIIGFRILFGGSGYSGTPTITLSNPDLPGGTPATIGTITITSGSITNVALSGQGSGYSYHPTVTVSGGGAITQAQLEPVIQRVSSTYTLLKVEGDGYLEENPYQLQGITVVSGGSNIQSLTFTFTDPDLPGGIKATATATVSGGVVTGVTVTNSGYGYSNPFFTASQNISAPNIVLVNITPVSGQTPTAPVLSAVTKKNEAELIPIINASGEIEQVIITKPGIGYTFANVIVETTLPSNTPGFEEASILLNFSIGDIDSVQSTVELTAIDGAIHAIRVLDPGSGYTTAPTVTITGDGDGCTATAVLTSTGSIQKINVNNVGSGYTKATVTLSGVAGNPAIAEAVISPKGGHGKDSISELYSKTIVFHGILSNEKNKGFSLTNEFRQLFIVKNPKVFNKNENLRLGLASPCFVAIGSKNQPGFSLINKDDVLSYVNTSVVPNKTYQFRVIEKNENYSSTESALLLSYLDNYITSAGVTISKVGATFSTTSIILPDVNKYSGDLVTIDNRVSFSPSTEQVVVATNSISF
jgi:hypothetical protein